jgi:hypothetical protein
MGEVTVELLPEFYQVNPRAVFVVLYRNPCVLVVSWP